jgi:transcription initiation factor TFIIIB Brf1 subunit/transcription initiation factor TFIIB
MEPIYLVRCINCKRKDFHEEHEGGKLVCDNCGIVGHTETISQQEIDDIAQQLLQSTIAEPEMDAVYLEMMAEYNKKESEKPLEKQLEELSMEEQKKPSKRQQKPSLSSKTS